MKTPNANKKQVSFRSKQELYKLWWLSGDVCNKSGVLGNWSVNSHLKMCFDRIYPGSLGGI